MNGLVYLLNEAGEALAQANAEITRLRAENDGLLAEIAQLAADPSDASERRP